MDPVPEHLPAATPSLRRSVPVRNRTGIGNYVAPLTAILLGAVSVGMLAWSSWQWDDHSAHMMPLVDNLLLAQDAIAEGYVWVEAHLRDEAAVDEETVAGAFGLAVAAIDDALEARGYGENPEPAPRPGEVLTNRLLAYRETIAHTRDLARQRIRLSATDPAAQQFDLRLFAALHGLRLIAESVSSALQEEWRRALDSQRRLQDWTLAVWVLLVGGASVALLLTGHRRARAETELAQAHRDLETKVEARTAELADANRLLSTEVEERRQTEQALTRSEADLRILSAQLLTVQEDERARIARELHDGISQNLSAMKFRVEHANTQIRDGDPAGAGASCKTVVGMLQEALDDVRRTYMALRPSLLDDLGLIAALKWFCREFQETNQEIRIELELAVEEDTVADALKVTIFRIVQESLNNVGKHSGAARARVFLQEGPHGLELLVEDDGHGYSAPDPNSDPAPRGMGLRSMRERAFGSDGTFAVESAPGHGTRVRVTWGTDRTAAEADLGVGPVGSAMG